MLELSCVKEIGGHLHCEVKNMEIGEPGQGFTLYEGPIELALTNIMTHTFRITKTSILAAYQAFCFIRDKGKFFNLVDPESEKAFQLLASQVKEISIDTIIDSHTLPRGIQTLFYPCVEWNSHVCTSKFIPTQIKPIIRKNSLLLILPDGDQIEMVRGQVLYYS